MQQFSNQEIAELKSRVDQIQELLAGRSDDLSSAGGASQTSLLDQLSSNIQIRRIRRSHFGSAEMSGPTWDMMLDLMLANTHGRILSASDLATGAGVPLSSGLRMIAALEQRELVHRSIDERDRRRTIVRLTDHGIEQMATYFQKVDAASRNGRTLAA